MTSIDGYPAKIALRIGPAKTGKGNFLFQHIGDARVIVIGVGQNKPFYLPPIIEFLLHGHVRFIVDVYQKGKQVKAMLLKRVNSVIEKLIQNGAG